MFILLILIISIVFGFIVIKYGLNENTKKEIIKEITNEFFNERDLPIREEIKITKDFSIKLYELKYKDENNQVLDTDDLTYLKLVKLINNPDSEYIKIDFSENNISGEMEVDVHTVDFRLKEHEVAYAELIGLATNFNLAQFAFKNKKGDIDFKLLNLQTDVIEKMKNHTDDIIAEIFPHIIELLAEQEGTGILQKAFEEKFLK